MLRSIHDSSARGPSARRLRAVLAGVLAIAATAIAAPAASAAPWSCDAFGYLFQTPPTGTHDLQQVDLATGAVTDPPGTTSEQVNAVGYNVLDDYVYGWSVDTRRLVRVHGDGTVEGLPTPAAIDTTLNFNIGDVDANGHYWMATNGQGTPRWHEIDFAPGSPTYGEVLRSGTVSTWPNTLDLPFGSDWAWTNGAFYSVAHGTGGGYRLASFTPDGVAHDRGPLPLSSPVGFGAVYADAAGYLYASDNDSGRIYRIDPVTGETIFVTDGPASGANDGARCARAPIPTITVTKTVAGRMLPADQFTVGLGDGAGDTLTSATTAGTATTVSTTDWPVSQGATYTITDAMAAGSPSPLSEYETSVVCTDGDGNEVPTGGSSPNWTLTVAVPANYTCNVTNALPPADLAIAKSGPATVDPGGRITWTLEVSNTGPGTSSGSTVTDSIPAGVADAATSTPGCTLAGATVRCEVGRLAAGAATEISVTGTAPDAPSTCVTNEATVSSEQEDPDASNNSATVTTCTPPPPTPPAPPPPGPPVPANAAVTITKTASAPSVPVGDTVTYTLVATNTGPAAATDTVVADTVPSRLDAQSAATSQGACTVTGNRVSCALGTLAAGQAVTVTVRAVAIRTGSATNAATVTSPQCTTTPCDTGTVTVRITKPRLALSKTVGRSTLRAGDTTTYTLRVRNPSRRAVRNVRVCDRLPSGLVLVKSSPRARLAGGQHCWTVKQLGAGKSKTFKLTVRALPGASGRKVNRATATSPDATSARAQRTVRVQAGAVRAGGVTG